MKSPRSLPGFITTNLCLIIVLLATACAKDNIADDRPDFIFQGTLTDITDGTPKDGWTVNLQENLPLYQQPQGWFVPTSFGFDSIRSGGHFSMEVNAYTNFRLNGNASLDESGEAKRDYYSNYVLSFCSSGCFSSFFGRPAHLFLDPEDTDLKLDEFDFSVRGEVITRNVKIFTGDFGKVTYGYNVERETGGRGTHSAATTFRDLAFGKPYLKVIPNVFGPVEAGEEYERRVRLPVGRSVEAVTSFKTITVGENHNILVIDSLVFRDTFLLQDSGDTLQARSYTY